MSSFVKSRFFIAFVLCAFVIFAGSGCGKKADEGSFQLRIRLDNDPTTLDPAYVVDVTGGNISAKIYSGLVKLDERMQIVGDLAESFEVSENGTRYTFFLKKGVRFHCGRECRAEDIRFSFERILAQETDSPRRRVLERIKGADTWTGADDGHVEGIEIGGPYSLTLILDKPYSAFLSLLTMPTAYVVCSSCCGSHSGSLPCGTGPYRFHEWKHDRHLILHVNADYFGVKPEGLTGIIYYIVPEDFTAMAEFRKGHIDVMEIPTSLLPYLKKEKGRGFTIEQGLTLSTYYIGLDCRKDVFKDREIRQAVSMAVDKNVLIQHLMEGTVVGAHGPIPPILSGHIEKDVVPFDLEKAKKICQRENMDEKPLKLFAKSSKENTDIVSAVASDLEKAGFSIEIELRDWSSLKESVNKGEADLFFLSWWADIPDGVDFLFPTFHSSNLGSAGNRSFFQDSRVDSLIEKALAAPAASEKEELYRRISRIIAEECPWVFLWHKKSYYAVSQDLSGFQVYPMYNMDKGEGYKLKVKSEKFKSEKQKIKE
ncbi:MAG: ABC transporter substrate-binding protein [Candidatus Aureabacteria bacterium]|nr:ABC transporter substrate-binding protein [Candidatus Auribacterota bacterium]